jgi:methylmalonyl-CoA mutase cobalamin-binding subunit
MKDILIVVSPISSQHLEICKTLSRAAEAYGQEVKEILGSAWLLTGRKSFEAAMSIYQIAFDKKLPVAAFEIESVLSCPSQRESDEIRQT